MPEQEKEKEKVKPSEKLVDIDTSGPEKEVAVEEVKEEAVVETKEETPRITDVEKEEPKKEEPKKEDDSKLEDYSKGVQSRIAKLTRKMREAERREAAATEYASSLEQARKLDQDRFWLNQSLIFNCFHFFVSDRACRRNYIIKSNAKLNTSMQNWSKSTKINAKSIKIDKN